MDRIERARLCQKGFHHTFSVFTFREFLFDEEQLNHVDSGKLLLHKKQLQQNHLRVISLNDIASLRN